MPRCWMPLESSNQSEPTWSSWGEAAKVILHRPYLVRTTRVALIVGAILFAINHYEEMIAGDVAPSTWLKAAATCIVPFSVANWGILTARRRKEKS